MHGMLQYMGVTKVEHDWDTELILELPTFLHANIVMLVFLHDVLHFLFHFMKIWKLIFLCEMWTSLYLIYESGWLFSSIKYEILDISYRKILALLFEDMETHKKMDYLYWGNEA